MATNQWGRIGYKMVIPLAGAMVVKRFNRKLAEGMVIGGAVMVLNDLLAYAMSASGAGGVTGTSEYLDRPAGYGAAGYDAINDFGAAPSIYNSESAFASSAWE